MAIELKLEKRRRDKKIQSAREEIRLTDLEQDDNVEKKVKNLYQG